MNLWVAGGKKMFPLDCKGWRSRMMWAKKEESSVIEGEGPYTEKKQTKKKVGGAGGSGERVVWDFNRKGGKKKTKQLGTRQESGQGAGNEREEGKFGGMWAALFSEDGPCYLVAILFGERGKRNEEPLSEGEICFPEPKREKGS